MKLLGIFQDMGHCTAKDQATKGLVTASSIQAKDLEFFLRAEGHASNHFSHSCLLGLLKSFVDF